MNRLWPKIGVVASLLWAVTPLLKAEMATRRWGTPPAGPPNTKGNTLRPKPPEKPQPLPGAPRESSPAGG